MSSLKDIIKDNFIKGCIFLLDKDKTRLRLQGHYASGQLERSLRVVAYFENDKLVADFFMKRYGLDLDKGLRPSQIFSRPQDYEGWIKIIKPGLSEQEVKRFAFNTWRKHKTEGMPTKASLKFSKTGERTNWIKRGSELANKDFEDLFNIVAFLLRYVEELDEAA